MNRSARLATLLSIEFHRFSLQSPQAKALLIAIALMVPIVGFFEIRSNLGMEAVIFTVLIGLKIVLVQLVISVGEHYVATPTYNKLYVERNVNSVAVIAQSILTTTIFLILSLPSFIILAVVLRSAPGLAFSILLVVVSTGFSVAIWHALFCRATVYLLGESVVSTIAVSILAIAILLLTVSAGFICSKLFFCSMMASFGLATLVSICLIPPAWIVNANIKLGTRD